MSWTWDNNIITFDQTCWTFDGSNTCPRGHYPGYPKEYTRVRRDSFKERLLREDREIIDIVATIVTKGVL